MGENSKIEWTHHTFNPWIGCAKVSPGCAHCYAEREFDHRHHKAKWGPGQPRVRTSPGTWAQPLRWDRAAAKAGVRARVFCASLADVFDPEVPVAWLADLMVLIEKCRNLDWLLLTKRPQEIAGRLHEAHAHIEGIKESWDEVPEPTCPASEMLNEWPVGNPPPHVWLGTTVENQATADERIPRLLKVPARIRFLSCEPLLGPVDLRYIRTYSYGTTSRETNVLTGQSMVYMNDGGGIESSPRDHIDWIICGGESGPKARPMHPEWARSLRDQAQAAGTPFMFKQWGEWLPGHQYDAEHRKSDPEIESSRFDMREWDGEEWDTPADPWDTDEHAVFRVGKVRAGRRLDGRTWDGAPS